MVRLQRLHHYLVRVLDRDFQSHYGAIATIKFLLS